MEPRPTRATKDERYRRALVQRLGWFASEKGDALREGVVAIETEAHNLVLDAVAEKVKGLPFRRMTGEGLGNGGTTGDLFVDWDEYDDVLSKAAVLRIIEEARRG